EDHRVPADPGVAADRDLLDVDPLFADRDVEAVEVVLAGSVEDVDEVADQAVAADAGVLDVGVVADDGEPADAEGRPFEDAAEPEDRTVADGGAEPPVEL